MYKCCDCGHIFEDGEEKKISECVGEYGGSPAYEEYTACPVCNGSYEEIKPCKICGSYDHDYDEDFCELCKKDVLKRFQNFVNNEFGEEEKELLNELYDGQSI